MRRALIAALPVLLGLGPSRGGCGGGDGDHPGAAGSGGANASGGERAGAAGKAASSATGGSVGAGAGGAVVGGSPPLGGAPAHGKVPAWALDESLWTTIPNPAPAPNCTFSETLLPEGDETTWEWKDAGQGVARATLFAPAYTPAASTHRLVGSATPVLWGSSSARYDSGSTKLVAHYQLATGRLLGAVRSVEVPNPTKYTQCWFGVPQGETAMVSGTGATGASMNDKKAFSFASVLRLDGSRFDRYFFTSDAPAPAGAVLDVEPDGIARYVFSGLGVVGWLPDIGSPKPEYILANTPELGGVGEGDLAVFLSNQNTRREVRAWDVRGKDIVTLWEQPKTGTGSRSARRASSA